MDFDAASDLDLDAAAWALLLRVPGDDLHHRYLSPRRQAHHQFPHLPGVSQLFPHHARRPHHAYVVADPAVVEAATAEPARRWQGPVPYWTRAVEEIPDRGLFSREPGES